MAATCSSVTPTVRKADSRLPSGPITPRAAYSASTSSAAASTMRRSTCCRSSSRPTDSTASSRLCTRSRVPRAASRRACSSSSNSSSLSCGSSRTWASRASSELPTGDPPGPVHGVESRPSFRALCPGGGSPKRTVQDRAGPRPGPSAASLRGSRDGACRGTVRSPDAFPPPARGAGAELRVPAAVDDAGAGQVAQRRREHVDQAGEGPGREEQQGAQGVQPEEDRGGWPGRPGCTRRRRCRGRPRGRGGRARRRRRARPGRTGRVRRPGCGRGRVRRAGPG